MKKWFDIQINPQNGAPPRPKSKPKIKFSYRPGWFTMSTDMRIKYLDREIRIHEDAIASMQQIPKHNFILPDDKHSSYINPEASRALKKGKY